jgi:hypothetical protein
LNKERTEGRYVSLKEGNKILRQELETVKSEYDQLLNDLNELKENYTDLDLSSAKSLHRCEVSSIVSLLIYRSPEVLCNVNNEIWYIMVWCGVVWCGVVWYGMVWYGVVWCGMVSTL